MPKRRPSPPKPPHPPASPPRPPLELLDGETWADADLSGTRLDNRFDLIRSLGAGGMGTVYLARRLLLRDLVAIKVLAPRYAWDKEWIHRFIVEAQATQKVRHDNIVQILDLHAPGRGRVYMVLEYVEGESLADLADRIGPMPWPRALRIADQIAAALEAAHARGIVHRDIKPSNCICGAGDTVKVLDFGIAKILDPRSHGMVVPHTATGLWMGTAEFMALEQFRGAATDARVDVYSLGALLFKLLSGRTPYVGTHFEVANQMTKSRAPRLTEAAPLDVMIPPAVDDLVARALVHDPARRTPSMTALRRDIAAALADAEEALEPTVLYALSPTMLARNHAPGSRTAANSPEPPALPAPPRPVAPRRVAWRVGQSTWLAAATCLAVFLVGMLALMGGSRASVLQDSSPPGAAQAVPKDIQTDAPSAPPATAPDAPAPPATAPDAPAPSPLGTPVPAPPSPNATPDAVPTPSPPATPDAVPTPSPPKPTRPQLKLPVGGATPKQDLKPPPKKPPPPPPPSRPRSLSESELRARITAIAPRVLDGCFTTKSIVRGTRVTAQIDVDPAGKAQLRFTGSAIAGLRTCVESWLRDLEFPATEQGGSLAFPFIAP